MARLSHFQAGAAIARMEPFKSNTGSFRGVKGGPDRSTLMSRLGNEEIDKMNEKNPEYTVMSYNTPIAYHAGGQWHYPDRSYSSTTSKHQAITRGAIGVKSASDKKREERAARKKAKADAQEQTLWNQ